MSSFRPGPGPTGLRNVPPKGYVAGLGRGAAGFTTRSDIGGAVSSTNTGLNLDSSHLDGSGSRAAEMRAAKLQMKNLQQQQQQQSISAVPGPFGAAPQGYIAGEKYHTSGQRFIYLFALCLIMIELGLSIKKAAVEVQDLKRMMIMKMTLVDRWVLIPLEDIMKAFLVQHHMMMTTRKQIKYIMLLMKE